MKKFLLLLIVPLCFFGLIKKASAASSNYEIRFYETECNVPIGGNVYNYLPTAYVYNTLTDSIVTDEGMQYTYNYQGIKFENINTSRPGHSIGYIYAAHPNYSAPRILQKIDVYVYDDVAPELDVLGNINKRYNEEVSVLDYISYSDNSTRVCMVELVGEYNPNIIGIYGLTVRVSDDSGNFTDGYITIRVYDDIKPVIECDDIISVEINSVFNKDDYIKVYDEYDGLLEYNLDDIDTSKFGESDYTIVATDSSGNRISKTFKIKIKDDVKPILNLKEEVLYVTDEYNLLDNIIELSDNYEDLKLEDVKIEKKRIGTQKFLVTYSVSDSSDNEVVKEVILNIDYVNKPVIEAINLDDLKDVFDPLYYVNCYDVEDGDLNSKVMVVDMNYDEKYCIYEVYDSDNNLTRKRIDFISSEDMDKYERTNKIAIPNTLDLEQNPISDNENVIKNSTEYKNNNYNYIYYIVLGIFVLGIILFIIIKHFRKKMV